MPVCCTWWSTCTPSQMPVLHMNVIGTWKYLILTMEHSLLGDAESSKQTPDFAI